MKILYIAGLAHSGSTYTARVLNQHSDVFSAGELEYLDERIQDGYKTCSCTADSGGRIKDRCHFWEELMEPLVDEIDVERTARLTLERSKEWALALYQEYFTGVDQVFEEGNRRLFERISSFTESSLIIDGSKSPWRLIPLKQIFGDDLYVLHIVRRPRDQMVSHVNRGRNFYHSAFMKYLRKNLVYSWEFSSDPGYRKLRLEEFVKEPEDKLREIFDWMNLPYEDPFRKSQQPYHHLSGSDATVPEILPEPDPERIRKDEQELGLLRQGVLNLVKGVY